MTPESFHKEFESVVNRAVSFVILPHVSADGDAVGSALALEYLLEEQGKKARVILDEPIPDKYAFLDAEDTIEVYEEGMSCDADICIAVDTGDINRLGNRKNIFECSRTWNIDHHKTNSGYGDYNFIDLTAASTGEIIYDLYRYFGVKPDKKAADALFTAISTDTGGLRYSNTTPKSMRYCADLLEAGVDVSEITHRVFDMTPYQKLLLKAVAIENMRLHFSGRLALITLKNEDYAFLMGKDEYFDGIVNIANNTEGVFVGVLMRETSSGDIKVNLRSSTDEIDVAEFARINNGGGHVRAAGFTSAGREFSDVYNGIISYFGKILDGE